MTLVRSRSPLRLGLAGGGSDVSPYSDKYGGCVLNVTISLYAHCTIEVLNSEKVIIEAQDLGQKLEFESVYPLPLGGLLNMHKAVYNRIINQFHSDSPLGLRITTRSDAIPGSGLGSSSSVLVAILSAFRELLSLPLGEYDLAHLAYEIERFDCGISGGKQDQYAATFGGFNFIEFFAEDRVVVNPLRVRRHIENELQSRILLYFTGISRESSHIIQDQINSAKGSLEDNPSLRAMHEIKESAIAMKEYLLRGDLDSISDLLSKTWESKKRTSSVITNSSIDKVEKIVFEAGADSLKVTGAGGGGFLMIISNPDYHISIRNSLSVSDGFLQQFHFTHEGCEAWTVR